MCEAQVDVFSSVQGNGIAELNSTLKPQRYGCVFGSGFLEDVFCPGIALCASDGRISARKCMVEERFRIYFHFFSLPPPPPTSSLETYLYEVGSGRGRGLSLGVNSRIMAIFWGVGARPEDSGNSRSLGACGMPAYFGGARGVFLREDGKGRRRHEMLIFGGWQLGCARSPPRFAAGGICAIYSG